jgi:hypothetical protein
MKSWKTSVTGIASVLIAVAGAVQLIFDGDPATNPDWNVTVAAVVAGIGLMTARDNSVTSEAAGAIKP